jgi:hypothetical protein
VLPGLQRDDVARVVVEHAVHVQLARRPAGLTDLDVGDVGVPQGADVPGVPPTPLAPLGAVQRRARRALGGEQAAQRAHGELSRLEDPVVDGHVEDLARGGAGVLAADLDEERAGGVVDGAGEADGAGGGLELAVTSASRGVEPGLQGLPVEGPRGGGARRAVATLRAGDELVAELARREVAGEQVADDAEAEQGHRLGPVGHGVSWGHGVSGSG